MPGICSENAPVRADADAKASNESAVLRVAHLVTEAGKQSAWTEILSGERANGADREGARHSCFEAFAADISHDNQRATIRLLKNLVEVFADFLREHISCFKPVPGKRGKRCGHESLLDFARGIQLCSCTGLLTADSRESEEDDNRDRQQK